MKKSLLLIVSLTLLLFFASSSSSSQRGVKEGETAANIALCNSDTTTSLQAMRGKYVLLSFWSSSDAESRIANIQNAALAKEFNGKLTLVSVNFDRDETIFNEIVAGDKLQKGTQFYDREGKNSSTFEDYNLGRGYKTYLINPAGKIEAENPGALKLATILRQ